MKKILSILTVAVLMGVSAQASVNYSASAFTSNAADYGAFGIHGDMFNAYVGFGTQSTDNSLGNDSSRTDIILKGDYRLATGDDSAVVFGALYGIISGETNGDDFDATSAFGLYVGVEQALSDNVILRANYFPIYTQTVDTDNSSVKQDTSAVGSVVEFGVSYVF